MPTVVTKVVNPAGGPGVDYTTLTLFESGEQRDLVTLDEIARALCTGTFNELLTIAQWPSDNDHYVLIEGSAKLGTKWDSGKATIRGAPSSGTTAVILCGATAFHVWIKNFQVEHTGTTNSTSIRNNTPGSAVDSWLKVEGCIVRGPTSNQNACNGIHMRIGHRRLYCWNTIFYNINHTGLPTQNPRGINLEFGIQKAWVYNCTFVDCKEGIFNGSTQDAHLKNSLCYNAPYTLSGLNSWAADSTNNSQEGFAPGSNPSNGSNEDMFIDYAGDDFGLDLADTIARWKGANLAADADIAILDDIIGGSRTAPYDIGVHETEDPILLTPKSVIALITKNPVLSGGVSPSPSLVGQLAIAPAIPGEITRSPALTGLSDPDELTAGDVDQAIALTGHMTLAGSLLASLGMSPQLIAQIDYDPSTDGSVAKDPSLIGYIDKDPTVQGEL